MDLCYNGSNTRKAEYYYGSDGNLAQVVDRSANVRRLPVYDLSDRLVSVKEFSGASLESRNVRSSVDYTYADKTNYITHKRYSLPQENTVISSTFSYGNASSGQMPDAVYSIQSASTLKRTYEYDSLGRRTQENVYSGDKLLFKNAISFTSSSVEADDDLSRSTNLVRMYSTKTGWYGYSYDANGNISSMLFNKTGGSMNGVWYYYDGLNRLTRVNDRIVGKTYSYSYDANGNITSKTECDYTTGDIPSDAAKVTYTYDSAWKDLLVQYGSKSITYDAIGNPTRIGNSTLTWTGRQLDSYSDGTKNCNFTYDINGQRYKKTVNGTTTEYYYGDGKLFAQKTGGRVLLFRYDENDLPIGVTVRENSTRKNYFYVKNVQGDITAIVDSTGNIVAEYSYDVWGKLIGMTDTSGTGIGTDNPLRYRGYYYDTETQLYYVSSRYYNPEFGRWINADSQLSTGDLNGMNLFAYCGNNPINRVDPTGKAWWHWAIGAAIVVGCGVATVLTCGGFAAAATAVCLVSSGAAAATTASTVAAGAFLGAVVTYGMAALSSAVTSNSVNDFNEQGNWGTVVATAGGAALGGAGAYFNAKVSYSAPSATKPKVTSTIKNDIIDLPRTGSALKTDPYHAFPNIVDDYVCYATKGPISNGTLYQLQGSLNGKVGRFEWIIQNQQVTHRMFVPGGGINGIPIMP